MHSSTSQNHENVLRTAGPFSMDLHRSDPDGSADARLTKGHLLSERIMETVCGMGHSKKLAYKSCVRVNMLLESEMDALISNGDLLAQWCKERIDHMEA